MLKKRQSASKRLLTPSSSKVSGGLEIKGSCDRSVEDMVQMITMEGEPFCLSLWRRAFAKGYKIFLNRDIQLSTAESHNSLAVKGPR